MSKFVSLALAATALTFGVPVAAAHADDAAQTTSTVAAREGQVLYDGAGKRVVTVNRVTREGAVKIIFDGRLITVPSASLSVVDGKLTTSLTRAEIAKVR